MSNAAVMMNVVLRLRPALLREGNRLCAVIRHADGWMGAARYRWEGYRERNSIYAREES